VAADSDFWFLLRNKLQSPASYSYELADFPANVIVFFHVLFVATVVIAVPLILLGWVAEVEVGAHFWFRLIHVIMIMSWL